MTWLVLQAAAITLVLTEGSIFGRLRTFGPALWRQLISCSLCLGVWVGMGLYALHALPVVWSWRLGVEVLGFGCVSGVTSFLGAQLIACLDRWSGPDEVQPPAPQVVSHSQKPSPEVLKLVQEAREKALKIPPAVGQ